MIDNPFVLLKPEGLAGSRKSFVNFFRKKGFDLVKELNIFDWPNLSRAIYTRGFELESHLKAMQIILPDLHNKGKYIELTDGSNNLEQQCYKLNELKYQFRKSLLFTGDLDLFYRGEFGNFKIYLTQIHVPDKEKFFLEKEAIKKYIRWN